MKFQTSGVALIVAALVVDGAIDPNCTVQKICVPGYTATIRPKVSYTDKLKIQQMKEHNLAGDPSSYEEDHFISLELCGSPTSPDNLWPEPWPEARKKDVDETHLHHMVCKGQINLQYAQAELRRKWKIHY